MLADPWSPVAGALTTNNFTFTDTTTNSFYRNGGN
jgi:hypothetical protein